MRLVLFLICTDYASIKCTTMTFETIIFVFTVTSNMSAADTIELTGDLPLTLSIRVYPAPKN